MRFNFKIAGCHAKVQNHDLMAGDRSFDTRSAISQKLMALIAS
jgi:hypothetical protein